MISSGSVGPSDIWLICRGKAWRAYHPSSEGSIALYEDALRSKSPAGFNPQCAGIPAVRRGTLELMRSKDLLNLIRALTGADAPKFIFSPLSAIAVQCE
jgi:hypothetical protein